MGCQQGGTSLHIRDYRDDGQVVRYQQPFTQAFFEINSAGELDVVFRHEVPIEGNPRRVIEQIVHIKSIWHNRYEQSASEQGQISGTMTYAIIDGAHISLYSGTGSTHFSHDRNKNMLHGSIGQVVLNSQGGAAPVFRRAEVTGRFNAQRNRREVVRLTNRLERYLRESNDRRNRSQ